MTQRPNSTTAHKDKHISSDRDSGRPLNTAFTFVDEHQLHCGTEGDVIHVKALAVVVVAASSGNRVFDRANPRVVPASTQQ